MPADVLTPKDLKKRLERGDDVVVLDVRESWEVDLVPWPDALWIPFDEVKERMDEVPRDKDIVVVCHHGVRSAFAARAISNAGHERVFNLVGGVDRWRLEVDPTFPRY